MSMNPSCQECGIEDAEVVLCAEHVEARIAAAVAAETERMAALLKDPHAVMVNILRGVIVLPEGFIRRHEWEALIESAVAGEREACAKLAIETACAGNSESWWAAQTAIAEAIRARGGKS